MRAKPLEAEDTDSRTMGGSCRRRRCRKPRMRTLGPLFIAPLLFLGVLPAPAQGASLDPLEVVAAEAADRRTILLIVQHTGETVLQNVSVHWEDASGTLRDLALPTTPPGAVMTLPLVAEWGSGPQVVSVRFVSARDAAYTRAQDIVFHIEAAGDGLEVFMPEKREVDVEFEGAREQRGPNTTFAWVVLVAAVVAMPIELAYGVYRRRKREAAQETRRPGQDHPPE